MPNEYAWQQPRFQWEVEPVDMAAGIVRLMNRDNHHFLTMTPEHTIRLSLDPCGRPAPPRLPSRAPDEPCLP